MNNKNRIFPKYFIFLILIFHARYQKISVYREKNVTQELNTRDFAIFMSNIFRNVWVPNERFHRVNLFSILTYDVKLMSN